MMPPADAQVRKGNLHFSLEINYHGYPPRLVEHLIEKINMKLRLALVTIVILIFGMGLVLLT